MASSKRSKVFWLRLCCAARTHVKVGVVIGPDYFVGFSFATFTVNPIPTLFKGRLSPQTQPNQFGIGVAAHVGFQGLGDYVNAPYGLAALNLEWVRWSAKRDVGFTTQLDLGVEFCSVWGTIGPIPHAKLTMGVAF